MPKPFENSVTQIAYNSIHDFFYYCELSHALKYTNGILEAATCDKVWCNEAPSSLLFFMENFRSLYAAAFVIHYTYFKENRRGISSIKGQGAGYFDY